MTEEDFIEHHANLSFGIPTPREFHELVSNCWGLDGCGDHPLVENSAVFDCAGGSHRSFLVTYADGSQSVEELPFSSEVIKFSFLLGREVTDSVVDWGTEFVNICCKYRLFRTRQLGGYLDG